MSADFEELARNFVLKNKTLKSITAEIESAKIVLRRYAEQEWDDYANDDEPTIHVAGATITKSDAEPSPPILAHALHSAVGGSAFMDVVGEWWKDAKIPGGKFDHVAWERLRREETVKDSDLRDALGETPSPKAWSVGTD